MQILVTGGGGFTNSTLVDALVDQGRQVAILDDPSVGKFASIEVQRKSGRFRAPSSRCRSSSGVAEIRGEIS